MVVSPISLIFQNKHWVVCDKPSGWLSIPSRMGRTDPRRVVGIELEQHLGQKIWPVHRLDYEVSGLLLFALDANAHRVGNRWFENHTIQKTYEAWSHPVPAAFEPGVQDWRCKLVRGKKRAFEADYGKESITTAQAIAYINFNDLRCLRWQLLPRTGRSHQLRYELARHGSAILGDDLYGSQQHFFAQSIALRAVKLDFSSCAEAHDLGLPSTITAPELSTLVSNLGGYVSSQEFEVKVQDG